VDKEEEWQDEAADRSSRPRGARSVATRPPGPACSPEGRFPTPEVLAKPTRRQFTAEYRMQILEEADRCTDPGEIGRLLRREGLYSSHLSNWRKARRQGALSGLTPKKRGRKPTRTNPLAPKVQALEAKVKRLERELAAAHTIIEVQGKVAGLLEFSLEGGKDC